MKEFLCNFVIILWKEIFDNVEYITFIKYLRNIPTSVDQVLRFIRSSKF